MSETKKLILIQLAFHPYLGYRKLSKRTGLAIGNIRSHLRRVKSSRSLMELGLVMNSIHGWTLTPKGEQFVLKLQENQKWWEFFVYGVYLNIPMTRNF
ncbi:MAG: hypothetical protein ACFFCQ_09050 [Promethearchaeota archaeon]